MTSSKKFTFDFYYSWQLLISYLLH